MTNRKLFNILKLMIEEQILAQLQEGFKTRKKLSEELGYSVDQIGKRARQLAAKGLIKRKDGLYGLTATAREDLSIPKALAEYPELAGSILVKPVQFNWPKYLTIGALMGFCSYLFGRYR